MRHSEPQNPDLDSDFFFGNVGSGWITIYGNELGFATLRSEKGNSPAGAKTLNFTGSFMGRICSRFLFGSRRPGSRKNGPYLAICNPAFKKAWVLTTHIGSGKLGFGIYFIAVCATWIRSNDTLNPSSTC
jgi:hypothetical protein